MSPLRSLLFLLLHFTCFSFSHRGSRRRHSAAQSPFKKKPKKSLLSFLKNLFSSPKQTPISPPIHSLPSPSSSTRSLRLNPPPDDTPSAIFSGGLHPCPLCGEIFPTATLLDHHQSTYHAVSDLLDGENVNIVRIIFKMGWPENSKSPTIHRILKIHNSPATAARFEEYRERVKSRAVAKIQALRDERCIVDGNELLRFYCTTFICDLSGGACGHQYCGACGIVRCGFSNKMDGIATLPTGWRAHAAVPEDLEQEFSFMKIKRAMLVCRVIAGRVGCDPGLADKDDPGFDSLEGAAPESGGGYGDELVVFNPTAVLPCFVIVYTV